MKPSTIDAVYELSPVQQGILIHTLSAPSSGMYFEQFSWAIRGNLDVTSLRAAWQQMVDRHPMLRTSFFWEELDNPMQVVHRSVTLPMEIHDFRHVPAHEQEARVTAFLVGDRQRGFALDAAPLMRCALLQLGADSYRFVWSFHHILLDGWSVARLNKEVTDLFDALCDGRVLDLPPVRPYRDYIGWLQKQDLASAESFWRKTLAGFTAPTPLVVNHAARLGDSQHEDYGSLTMLLSADETAAVQAFARSHRVTVNTIAQSAWALLLSRYSGERDVVIGITSSGRPVDVDGIDGTIGIFVNTLPMRVAVPEREPVASWLQRVQARNAEMRQFEYSPLVNIQGWSDVPRGLPLFSSIIGFENYPVDPTTRRTLRDLQFDDVRVFEKTNYALSAIIKPGPPFSIRLMYDTRQFDHDTIDRLLGHYRTLVLSLAADGSRAVAEVELLMPAERQYLAIGWNDTAAAFPRAACIHQLVEQQARRRPDAEAAASESSALTYGQLNGLANQLARLLIDRGVGPGVPVVVYMNRSPESIAAMLGVMKAGGAYVPIDPAYPSARTAFTIEDTATPVVLTHSSLIDRLQMITDAATICVDTIAAGKNGAELDVPARASLADLAYIIYTSGSTGQPKGVEITHDSLLNLVHWHNQSYGIGPGDRGTHLAGVGFDASVWEIWPYLAAGASLHLPSSETLLMPDALWAWLSSERITVTFLPTPLAEAALLRPLPAGLQLRTLLTGGDRLGKGIDGKLPFAFINHYGPTENTVVTTAGEVRRTADVAGPPSIGRPILNVSVYVLDERLHLVPVGVPGELYVGGASLARGYFRRADLTAERFCPDPFAATPGARLYRTGDIVKYLPGGDLQFIRRNDDQVKVRGFRIEIGEIEAVLRQHEAVADAVVVLKDDLGGEGALVAYAVPRAATLEAQPGQSEALAGDPNAGLAGDQIAEWQTLYDQTYGGEATTDDPTFNITGWNSSYTGLPIAEDEMREWVDTTVARIQSLRPKRILEIGCGTGLLLSRLAPDCERYVATDFSAAAIAHVRKATAGNPRFANVQLHQRLADDFAGVEPGAFDLVVINSVMQYFPHAEYLARVLEGAFSILAPGGRVFAGDLRSLPLLEAYHASVQAHSAPATLPVGDFGRRVERAQAREEELVIAPGFFAALARTNPRLTHAEVLVRRGRADNELTRFRYDAILHLDTPVVPAPDQQLAWTGAGSLAQVEELLTSAPALLVTGVPDRRVAPHARLAKAMHSADDARRVGEVTAALRDEAAATIDLEELWTVAGKTGRELAITYSGAGDAGLVDALFRRNDTAGPLPPIAVGPGVVTAAARGAALTNAPLREKSGAALSVALRQHLKDRLPDYMVPSAVVVLERLPLTPNGKVDRRALPAVEGTRPVDEAYLAPRTETEQRLAAIWQEVLRIDRIGVNDNFFDLGGHSLLATQVISRAREAFGLNVALANLFDSPTVAGLARHVDAIAAGDRPLASAREAGEL
jgi:amino acid adenylation domain-containing protein